MKVSVFKFYEKALSTFVVQKSMAIFKRPFKVPDMPKLMNMAAYKEHTIMEPPLVHDECPIPEERVTEKPSSHIFRRILSWPDMSPAPNPSNGSESASVKGRTHKKASIYKMGEYKITEKDSDDLMWEMHFGMGALKEGKCFRKGQILFLGPARDERPGFLTGEFLDDIKPFPCWMKTRYYSSGFHIRRCDTGEKVSEHEMRLWVNDSVRHLACKGDPQKHDSILKAGGPDGNNIDVSYALKNYEIVIKANGMVLWKRSGTHNRVNSGRCLIMEDILFIGPSENAQPDTLKRQFYERLKLLPKWDYTEYCSCYTAILDCNPER
jgi:hypothetical protein